MEYEAKLKPSEIKRNWTSQMTIIQVMTIHTEQKLDMQQLESDQSLMKRELEGSLIKPRVMKYKQVGSGINECMDQWTGK